MSTSKIQANTAKNRLYISLNGFMNDTEVETAVNLVMAETKKLKSGFTIINDISTFKPTTQKGAEAIAKLQLFMKQSGVSKTIRVVGPGAASAMQFNRVSKTTSIGVNEVETIEDAEKVLDGNK